MIDDPGPAAGGLGLGTAHLASLHEELGRGLAAVSAINTLLGADLIESYGSVLLQTRLLLPVLVGDTMIEPVVDGPSPSRITGGRLIGMVSNMPFGADVELLMVSAIAYTGDIVMAIVRAEGVRVVDRPLANSSGAWPR